MADGPPQPVPKRRERHDREDLTSRVGLALSGNANGIRPGGSPRQLTPQQWRGEVRRIPNVDVRQLAEACVSVDEDAQLDTGLPLDSVARLNKADLQLNAHILSEATEAHPPQAYFELGSSGDSKEARFVLSSTAEVANEGAQCRPHFVRCVHGDVPHGACRRGRR